MAFVCFSCKKGFLDRNPYNGVSSSVIFTSDENARLAVNGIYQAAGQNAFKDQFLAVTTYMGPDSYTYGRGGVNLGTTFPMGLGTARENTIPAIYQNLYRPIVYANDVIAGLDDNENVSEELRNRLIGEAKFLRGLCYFYLWNLFGDVVLFDKPTPVEETFLPRTPVAEVQALVISDFKDAAEKLPVSYTAADLGRATKGAAIAMLGKAYLYLQRWQEAETEFAKLLTAPFTYDLTADFGASFYWKTQNNKESVFELQYINEQNMGSNFERLFGNRSGGRGGENFCGAAMAAFRVFRNSDGSVIDISGYPKRSSYPTGNPGEVSYGIDLIKWYDETFKDADIRLHQSVIMPGATFFGNDNKYYKVYWPYQTYVGADPAALRTDWTSIGWVPIRKFLTLGEENIINAQTCPTNFPMIRFADVLLMYAEAVNEGRGPVQEAYNAVNRVRTRAKVAGFPAGLNKEQMRREIQLERYRELMFETHLFFDVKRWRLAHTTDPVFGLNNDVLDFRFERLYTRKFTENRDYLFPIPGAQIDLNPLLTQNPGWN